MAWFKLFATDNRHNLPSYQNFLSGTLFCTVPCCRGYKLQTFERVIKSSWETNKTNRRAAHLLSALTIKSNRMAQMILLAFLLFCTGKLFSISMKLCLTLRVLKCFAFPCISPQVEKTTISVRTSLFHEKPQPIDFTT
jgi:hypothetical protein